MDATDHEEPVSIYTVNNATEADIIRNALKAEGIACEIGGETQAGLAGVLEIDILVPADEAGRAKKVLRELRKQKKERRQRKIAARRAKEAGTPTKIGKDAIREGKPPARKKKPRPGA